MERDESVDTIRHHCPLPDITDDEDFRDVIKKLSKCDFPPASIVSRLASSGLPLIWRGLYRAADRALTLCECRSLTNDCNLAMQVSPFCNRAPEHL